MKMLIIPDVHLKHEMFQKATLLMEQGVADQTVCLMDIPDDWGKEKDVNLYIETFDAAIQFAKDFPNTLWCYGNHELSYQWNKYESGYSNAAKYDVQKKLLELRLLLMEQQSLQYIHRVDNVIFAHGGLSQTFVELFVPSKQQNDLDEVIKTVNNLGLEEMWCDISPIWFRPQYSPLRLYEPPGSRVLHVVGHTPVEKIIRHENFISCDVFSTDRTGTPIGTEEFLLLDTITWEHSGVKI